MPVDYSKGSFQDIAQSVYGSQGLGYTGDEYSTFVERAKGLGIRSPQAFGDMLKKELIQSGKVMTPQQEMLSYMFGTPNRDASGRLTNKYGSLSSFPALKTPEIPSAVTYQYGA